MCVCVADNIMGDRGLQAKEMLSHVVNAFVDVISWPVTGA